MSKRSLPGVQANPEEARALVARAFNVSEEEAGQLLGAAIMAGLVKCHLRAPSGRLVPLGLHKARSMGVVVEKGAGL